MMILGYMGTWVLICKFANNTDCDDDQCSLSPASPASVMWPVADLWTNKFYTDLFVRFLPNLLSLNDNSFTQIQIHRSACSPFRPNFYPVTILFATLCTAPRVKQWNISFVECLGNNCSTVHNEHNVHMLCCTVHTKQKQSSQPVAVLYWQSVTLVDH